VPVTLQLFSALKKMGIDEVHHALDELFSPQALAQAEGLTDVSIN
jgi:hypothetical protein